MLRGAWSSNLVYNAPYLDLRVQSTEELVPVSCAHSVAEEGAQAGAPYLLAVLRNEPRVTFYFFLLFCKYIKIPWITLPRHAPITAPAMVIPSISTYRNLFAENAHTHATTQHKTINPI